MLTLTPVVCMLSAIAFSSVFEHYLGDDMKRENPPIEDSSDEDDKRSSGSLYDKVGRSHSPGLIKQLRVGVQIKDQVLTVYNLTKLMQW